MVNILKGRRLKMLPNSFFGLRRAVCHIFLKTPEESKQVTYSQCNIKNSEDCADSGVTLVLLQPCDAAGSLIFILRFWQLEQLEGFD